MSDWVLEFPTLDLATLRGIQKSIDLAYRAFSRNYGDAIESFFDPLLYILVKFEWLLIAAPWWVVIAVIAGVCFAVSRRWRLTAGVAVAFFVIGYLGMWEKHDAHPGDHLRLDDHRHRHRDPRGYRHVPGPTGCRQW